MATTTTKIGVATATIIGMNAMIGSGIFSAPAALASNVGPAGIVAYILVVFSVLCMALSFAKLAQEFPQKGAFYTYAKQWSGHTGGMIASFLYITGLMIAMGLLVQMAGQYLHEAFPQLSSQTFGLLTLCTLISLNAFGVTLSELGQKILIVCTVFPLTATTLMCFSKGNLSNLTPFAPFGFGNVLRATRVVIFGFFGFECASSLFDIVKEPVKNVPKALTYSVLLVGALYTAFITSIIVSTPLELFSNASISITKILSSTFPHAQWVISIIHFSILSAIIGTIHSMIWSSSHLFLLITEKIRCTKININQRNAVLIVGAAILTTYLTLHDRNLFFNFTSLFLVTAYIMSMLALLFGNVQQTNLEKLRTIIGLVTAGAILFFAVENLLQAFTYLG